MADSLDPHDVPNIPDDILEAFNQPLEKLGLQSQILVGQMKDLSTAFQLVIRQTKSLIVPAPSSVGAGTVRQEVILAKTPEIQNLIKELRANTQIMSSERRSQVSQIATGVVAAEAIKSSTSSNASEVVGVRRREKVSEDEKQRRRDVHNANRREKRRLAREAKQTESEATSETASEEAEEAIPTPARRTLTPMLVDEDWQEKQLQKLGLMNRGKALAQDNQNRRRRQRDAQKKTAGMIDEMLSFGNLPGTPVPTPTTPTSTPVPVVPTPITPPVVPTPVTPPVSTGQTANWILRKLGQLPIDPTIPIGGSATDMPQVVPGAEPIFHHPGDLFGTSTPTLPTPVSPIPLPGGPGSSGGGTGGGGSGGGGGSSGGGASGGSGGGGPAGGSDTGPWSLEATQLQVLAAVQGINTGQTVQINLLTQQVAIATQQINMLSQISLFSQQMNSHVAQTNTVLTQINNFNRRPPAQPREMQLNRAANVMGGAALAGAGGMLGLSALIDPNALSTFTGSLKLLGQEIGKVFVPYVYMAADAIQDWTRWFASLDESYKTLIGRGTAWTVGILLAGAAITRVISGVTLLTGAFQRLGLWMAAGSITTPWIAGLAALGVVIGAVTAAWYGMGSAAKDASGAMMGATGPGGVPVKLEPLNKEKMTIFPPGIADKILGAKDKPERAKIIENWKTSIEEEINFLQGKMPENLRKKIQELAPAQKLLNEHAQKLHDAISGTDLETQSDAAEAIRLEQTKETRKAAAAAGIKLPDRLENMEVENRVLMRVTPIDLMPGGFNTDLGRQIAGLKANLGQIEGFSKMLGLDNINIHDLKSPVKSRYTDALSYRESVQLAALNVPETEAQAMLNQMTEFNKKMGQDGPLIKAITDQTEALAEVIRRMQPLQ